MLYDCWMVYLLFFDLVVGVSVVLVYGVDYWFFE